MARGGKRPGSGRPKGSLNHATLEVAAVLAAFQQQVCLAMEPMTKAQIRHAQGVDYMVLRKRDGTYARATDEKQIEAACAVGDQAFNIFTQAPNTQAFTALTDRAFGKPVERTEVGGPDGGPVIFKWQK